MHPKLPVTERGEDTMRILEKIKAKQEDLWGKPNVTIAFLGDSVTQGCFDVFWREGIGVDTYFDQDNGYHRQLGKLLAMLYPMVPFNIINAGISGTTASHGHKRLEQDVLSHNPDLVVVCFGLNDAMAGTEHIEEYTDALGKIFQSLQKADIEVIFMTPNMMCTKISDHVADDRIREIAERVCEVQNKGILEFYLTEAKRICKENQVPICDCYAKWQQLYQSGVSVTDLLSNKINHPTKEMNWLFAVSLMETILE